MQSNELNLTSDQEAAPQPIVSEFEAPEETETQNETLSTHQSKVLANLIDEVSCCEVSIGIECLVCGQYTDVPYTDTNDTARRMLHDGWNYKRFPAIQKEGTTMCCPECAKKGEDCE